MRLILILPRLFVESISRIFRIEGRLRFLDDMVKEQRFNFQDLHTLSLVFSV